MNRKSGLKILMNVVWVVMILAIAASLRIPRLTHLEVTDTEVPHLLQIASLAETDLLLAESHGVLGNEVRCFHQMTAPLVRFFSMRDNHYSLRAYRWSAMLFPLLALLFVPLFGLMRRQGLFVNEVSVGMAMLFMAVSPTLCAVSRTVTPDNVLLFIMGGVLVANRAYVQWPSLVAVFFVGALLALGVAVDGHFIVFVIAFFPAVLIGAGWSRLTIYWRSLHVVIGMVVLAALSYALAPQSCLSLDAIHASWQGGAVCQWLTAQLSPTTLIVSVPIVLLLIITCVWGWIRDDHRMVRFYSIYLLFVCLIACFDEGFFEVGYPILLSFVLMLAGNGVGILFEILESRRGALAAQIAVMAIALSWVAGQIITTIHDLKQIPPTGLSEVGHYRKLILEPTQTAYPNVLVSLSEPSRSQLLWQIRFAHTVLTAPPNTIPPALLSPGILFADIDQQATLSKQFQGLVFETIRLSHQHQILVAYPKGRQSLIRK